MMCKTLVLKIALILFYTLFFCSPRHAPKYVADYQMGIMHTDQKDIYISRLEKYKCLYPENWEIYYYLGLAYFDIKRYKKAKDNLNIALDKLDCNNNRQLININTRLKASYKNIGDEYFSIARYDSAAFYYRKALNLFDAFK
jgi:tetratricopeptide (TPR) repeat protein